MGVLVFEIKAFCTICVSQPSCALLYFCLTLLAMAESTSAQ